MSTGSLPKSCGFIASDIFPSCVKILTYLRPDHHQSLIVSRPSAPTSVNVSLWHLRSSKTVFIRGKHSTSKTSRENVIPSRDCVLSCSSCLNVNSVTSAVTSSSDRCPLSAAITADKADSYSPVSHVPTYTLTSRLRMLPLNEKSKTVHLVDSKTLNKL